MEWMLLSVIGWGDPEECFVYYIQTFLVAMVTCLCVMIAFLKG